ncbi:MAG: T9SS type A sorting domain-containing protein, partial [Saprospiraceae bacterium]
NEIYYIAVSSFNSVGGHFDICVNTISQASACVTNSQIQITARSEGGSLDGPFLPGETVSVCMDVNSYSAAGNGCQWFQGLIPFFGNGWNPSTFDSEGQPLNGTINGEPFGVAGNGLYSASTWDWFLGIGYHFDNPFFQIGDFDGNSTVEMCNILYDVDCPNFGGTIGGCCGPCWADAGDPLPPGWFCYGINGTCPTLGPPPTVDWGDGNTCGGGMGPWHFCFDLLVRDYPDCLTDPTTRDLTLGFFTTADGETGSWTGGPSICSMDQPIKRTFELQCPTQIDLGFEELPDVCDNSQFVYEISEPSVSHWTWDITPSWVVTDSIHDGENDYVISSVLHNQLNTPVTVTYIFTGIDTSTQNTVIKKVRFRILAPIVISFVDYLNVNVIDSIIVCSNDTNSIFIFAEVQNGTGNYNYSWWPIGTTVPSLLITPPFYSTIYTLDVSDEFCMATKNFTVIVDQNCVVNHIEIHNDESNDKPKKDDPPVGGGNVVNNHIDTRSVSTKDEESIRIYPTPSKDLITVEWSWSLLHPTQLFIYDTKGIVLKTLMIDQHSANQKEIDISDLSSGVYILTLHSKQKVESARMIKM